MMKLLLISLFFINLTGVYAKNKLENDDSTQSVFYLFEGESLEKGEEGKKCRVKYAVNSGYLGQLEAGGPSYHTHWHISDGKSDEINQLYIYSETDESTRPDFADSLNFTPINSNFYKVRKNGREKFKVKVRTGGFDFVNGLAGIIKSSITLEGQVTNPKMIHIKGSENLGIVKLTYDFKCKITSGGKL